jgi:hypothetical protein
MIFQGLRAMPIFDVAHYLIFRSRKIHNSSLAPTGMRVSRLQSIGSREFESINGIGEDTF